MNEKTRFTGKANHYTKGRSFYATSLLDYIVEVIGVSADSTVADIGAGTGIFSKQLLEKGCRVFCVEPNEDMRSSAAVTLADYDRASIVAGDAENTHLSEISVDFITAAQSFHWFDTDKFKAESKRILKSGGTVMLIWNQRDTESEFGKAYQGVFKKYCPNYKGFSGGLQKHDERIVRYFDGQYSYAEFENNITYDREHFISRCLSSSYSLKAEDEHYEAYLAELNSLFDKYSEGGKVIEPNKSVIYFGKL